MNLQGKYINGKGSIERKVIVIDPIESSEKAERLRVAAYARISSDSEDQINSFSAQISYYTELFNRHEEWEAIDIYMDQAVTGTRTDIRVDFQRMLKDCRLGKIDRILTKSISRFSRNTRDCLEILRELISLGITVYFEKENIDTGTMSNELIITLLSSGAQEESYSISNNMRWSYEHRMKSGSFITCTAPYGYRLIDGTLVVDQQEAEIVRYIFSNYLEGKGKSEIAAELNKKGTRLGLGKREWKYSTINYTLKNERYFGEAILQKRFTTTALPFKRKINYGEKNKYHLKGCHQGIISADVFYKVQELNSSRAIKKCLQASKHPLAQRIKCSECGSNFRRVVRRGKAYWTCHKHYTKGNEGCNAQQISEAEIYKAFMVLYNKIKINQNEIFIPMLDQLVKVKSNREISNFEILEIRKKIVNLTERKHVLSGLKSKGYIDSALFISQIDELNSKILKLRENKNLLIKNEGKDLAIRETKKIVSLLDNAPTCLTEFNQLIFESLVRIIVVNNDMMIKFCLKNGLGLYEKIGE